MKATPLFMFLAAGVALSAAEQASRSANQVSLFGGFDEASRPTVAMIEHALHARVDLLAQGSVLRLEVDELERRQIPVARYIVEDLHLELVFVRSRAGGR